MKSESLQTHKLRLALLNCICLAFSLREFQGSLFSAPTYSAPTIENLSYSNNNLLQNYRLALLILIVVAGINFW